MAETKAQLIEKARALGIATDGLTVVQLKQAIKDHKDRPAEEEAGGGEESPEYAKAGKRSKKSVLAEQAEAERQERKKAPVDPAKAAAAKKPKVRPRLERHGRKYRKALKEIDKAKKYDLAEAVKVILQTATTKFDSSVELSVNLKLDTKQADQNIRDQVDLPAGTGKEVRVAVFADDDSVKQALMAGAAVAGNEIFLQQLDNQEINFDVLITQPELMSRLSKYAKLLGPKGLMPSPKSGTITKNIARTVKEIKAGKVEYRVDENGVVHLPVGKVSFGDGKIKANIEAVLESIKANRPETVKGTYIDTAYLATTMGPSLQLQL